MILTVTLSTAAAMAVLSAWMMMRTGSLRGKLKILHGDGGNAQLMHRMRAQLNFVETAPFILALIALIELAGKGGMWLPYVAGLYIIARVAHVLGMDSDDVTKPRMFGVLITMLSLVGLAVVAVLIQLGIL